MNLPDPEFVECLEAQVAHLMMGLVGWETRPGEPTNYPLNWLRDGAHTVVALAQAGRLEVARQLAWHFAETDFFGGFGPEADGPGLALWALGEVAARIKQPQYDRWLWPHVARKAQLIVQMRAVTQPMHKPVSGPVVPQHVHRQDLGLVCEPARDGLIIGKMDWHRPVLFVNAVSYRGLLSAAEVADRVGDPVSAGYWRVQVAELRQAWARAFHTSEANNERAYIASLWPTWVVSDVPAYQQKLQSRWEATYDESGQLRTMPLWTYFNVAEAHQWLCLGQPDRVWKTLRWFWQHQASPGLYTWWEGSGEENTFRRWQQVRGWVKPAHVTPHYWTAAEMLLLQLDMLGCVDESGREPVWVIGAGIPREWLATPINVRGLSTRFGTMDWTWKDQTMDVVIRGRRWPVRPGPAFPPNTKTKVIVR
jgi:hypothetical protein